MACASSAAGLKNVSVGQSNGSRVSEPGMMQDSRTLGFLQQCAVAFQSWFPMLCLQNRRGKLVSAGEEQPASPAIEQV